MNNTTIFAADRTTHLKIVGLSLLASIAVIVTAVTAHTGSTEGVRVRAEASVVNAGRPYLTSRVDTAVIR
jgi:hypothetical protein